ncbi:hypothetical protein ACFVWN_00410 [Nocardiopsis flavescens]|uniref:Uncharacterized protein n=1 Tax=Nocardiopsis flavescens TaxID=758803 RepID=A0A1M6SWD3_9ACTN|nr:hypothetical protein [Nocardiopsis flavescens]SHK48977.1 hypothetical protein SAMN05421803_12151 [Nocardiopsis flavescens]
MLIAAHDRTRRDDRLAALGTSWPVMEKALRMSEAGLRRVTASHGRTASGQYAYHERLAALRSEQKVRYGWENVSHLQIDLTVDPAHTVGIQTLSGDSNTGNPEAVPRSQHPRGPNGRHLLTDESAFEQLSLPGLPEEFLPRPVEPSDLDGIRVWVLLTYRKPETDSGPVKWHSELSRPGPPDEQGYLTSWHERILFPALEIGSVVFPEDGEGMEPIDIPVGFR